MPVYVLMRFDSLLCSLPVAMKDCCTLLLRVWKYVGTCSSRVAVIKVDAPAGDRVVGIDCRRYVVFLVQPS